MGFNNSNILVMIPAEELENLKKSQRELAEKMEKLSENLNKQNLAIPKDYISAREFRKAVDIGQWKFDQLVSSNLIKTIKKKRKIYVLSSEVQRYFKDPSIQ